MRDFVVCDLDRRILLRQGYGGQAIRLSNSRSNRFFHSGRCFVAVSLLVLLTACGSAKPEAAVALPATAGEWKLTQEQALTDYPPVLATLGVVDARVAKYDGPSPVTVRIFRMKSSTVAFEALQKWQPQKGVMHFYRKAYFILAETPEMKFVDAFDKAVSWGSGV